ncbi:MAG: hypothetical protein H0T42_11965 [Deltaproteobacteria bacterium]|nr:hypothetical protein [Deltaproteobacteria bacterium]
MGFVDVFQRGRSSVLLGSRQFTLTIAGFGIEAKPRLPATIAHLVDGMLVFGPYDVAAARARGELKNVLIRPGTPPHGLLARHALSENSIVTYSSAQRGSTQLVLGTGMRDYDPVLESVTVADHPAQWRIVTDDHEIVWPATMVLRVDGNLANRTGPYELALDGSPDRLISFHGPLIGDRIPRPEQLLSPGQSWGESGSFTGTVKNVRWFTVGHTLGDAATLQRYYLVPIDRDAIYLLRAVATPDTAAAMFGAADFVARSLRPRF